MRNIIFGGIGTLWGFGIIVYSIVKGGPDARGAYGAGQVAGMVFGVLLFGVGLYYLIRGLMELKREKKEQRKKPRKLRRDS